MKVRVDPAKCQGHNRCFQTSEQLFQLDNYGYSSARGDGTVAPELQDKARLAVKNCPERAISISED
jgi:ferredoxin